MKIDRQKEGRKIEKVIKLPNLEMLIFRFVFGKHDIFQTET